MWTAMAVLSLPAAAVPGQAQADSMVTPPGATDALLISSFLEQAEASQSSAQTLSFDVAAMDSGGDAVSAVKELRFSKEPSGPGLGGAIANMASPTAAPAEQEPNAIRLEAPSLAQQTGEDAGSPTAPSVVPPEQDPNLGLRLPPGWAEGFPIQQVFVYLANPTGNAEQDEQLRRELATAFGIRAGTNFSPLFADQGLNRVQQLPFVEAAEYRLYQGDFINTANVALLVKLQPEPSEESAPTAQAPTGMVVSGSLSDFPTIYQDDRSLAKFILNGGLGLFSDTNPRFGRADVLAPGPYEPTGTVTWGEFYLEPGIAGITQIDDWPLYVYGAASYTLSSTVQPDIFRTDSRFYGAVEDLYGGVLVAAPDSPVAFNLSAGRQIFQLNQGFLFSQFSGSANALERGGSYFNPRTAYDMTVLADLHWGDFRLKGFFLEPDEFSVADTNTQYLGTSFSYNNNQGLEAVLSYITAPQSNRVYALPDGETFTREGLQVINPRLRLSTLFGVHGLWAEAEYAYQFSNQRSMSAQGGYFWLGYTAEEVSWQPSISYRFAGFSGDDPNTSTYGRFDPLQAGGLGDWLQGINLGKIYNNSNTFSHRITLQAQPSENLSLSLEYYYRFADELNNLGGTPALSTLNSRYIGQEFLLTSQYFLSDNFMLQGVGAIAFPGSAIREAANHDTSPWITLQLSLFMFF
jgi:hypothetical protein